MNNRPPNGVQSQIILGVIAIFAGVLFLLDNLDILEVRQVLRYWPVIFIIIGLVKVSDTSAPHQKFGGIIFIVIGSVLLMDKLGWLNVSFGMILPLLLVLFGVHVIMKAMVGESVSVASDEKGQAPDEDSLIKVSCLMSEVNRRYTSQDFRGGKVSAVMGGCEIDLRLCKLQTDAVITVNAVMGGIVIKVPTDWVVVMQGTPILGGFEDKTQVLSDPSKRLVVQGSSVLGGVEVTN